MSAPDQERRAEMFTIVSNRYQPSRKTWLLEYQDGTFAEVLPADLVQRIHTDTNEAKRLRIKEVLAS